MDGALKSMGTKLDDIDKSANEIVRYEEIVRDPRAAAGTRAEARWRKRGLDRRDEATLKDLAGTCEKIISASRDLSDALGEGSTDFAAVRADAGKAGRRAVQLLEADYSRVYFHPPEK